MGRPPRLRFFRKQLTSPPDTRQKPANTSRSPPTAPRQAETCAQLLLSFAGGLFDRLSPDARSFTVLGQPPALPGPRPFPAPGRGALTFGEPVCEVLLLLFAISVFAANSMPAVFSEGATFGPLRQPVDWPPSGGRNLRIQPSAVFRERPLPGSPATRGARPR